MEDRCNHSPNHCNISGVHLDVLNSPILDNSRRLSPKRFGTIKSLDQQKDDLLRQQDLKIKSLKRSIKTCQKTIDTQNTKLSSQDSLFLELNSLKKNNINLETELNEYKCEVMRLNEILQSRNQTMNEFQHLIEISTEKFNQFEDTNTALKQQLEQCESKLKVIPSLSNLNETLQGKVKELEAQISSMTIENNKKEEDYKEMIMNMEKGKTKIVRQLETELLNLKKTIEHIHADNDKLKQLYNEIQAYSNEKDITFTNKLNAKEKELDKMSKQLTALDQNLKDVDHNYTNQLLHNKDLYEQLFQEHIKLSNELNILKDHDNKSNEQLRDMENIINQSDYNLQLKDDHIKRQNEQIDQLTNQYNNSQLNLIEIEQFMKNETDILNKRLIISEKERNCLLSEKDIAKKDIASLKETIVQLKRNSNEHLIDCHEVDGKYNELVKVMQLKEDEYCREYERCLCELKKKEEEIVMLKEKKDKKIQLMKLTNEEQEARIKNLINTFISLREYALDIERNLYTNQLKTPMNNSSNSLSSTSGSLTNPQKDEINNSYSKKLIQGLKDIITKIDTKISNPITSLDSSSLLNPSPHTYEYSSFN